MNEDTLITHAAAGKLSEAELRQFAETHHMTLHGACDRIAELVGRGFLRGQYTWETGDAAMNHLYGLAYVQSDFCLSDFSWRVYEAFDEGEYIHAGSPAEFQGEPRTRTLLTILIGDRA